jgi:LemA protein
MDWAVLIPIVVVVVLVVGVAFYLWANYHSLVATGTRVDEGWRDISQEVSRRAELVPKLTQTVQAYATHEPAVFDAAERARAETLAATTPTAASAAENHLQQALRSVLHTAETYPQLHASTTFLQLQSELADSQERIQASRRFYNGGVREFNSRIEVFPNSLFARRLGYSRRDFFEVADATVAEPPRVQF